MSEILRDSGHDWFCVEDFFKMQSDLKASRLHVKSLESDKVELERKLADKNEYNFQLKNKVVDLEKKFAIAKEALNKLANDNSSPWDNLDWKRLSKEALKKLAEQRR